MIGSGLAIAVVELDKKGEGFLVIGPGIMTFF